MTIIIAMVSVITALCFEQHAQFHCGVPTASRSAAVLVSTARLVILLRETASVNQDLKEKTVSMVGLSPIDALGNLPQ